MPFFSNKEIRECPDNYEPAEILRTGHAKGPRCCGQPMKNDGGCSTGCCDDFRCELCGYKVRIEWPD